MSDQPIRMATFEKVPFEQFAKDLSKFHTTFAAETPEHDIRHLYNIIKLPVRATADSAGYDISTPIAFTLSKSTPTVVIPTGLRCRMDKSWFLNILPRSGLGFKHGIHLANTNGIIDGDYYNSDNYGHIMLKLAMDPTIGSNTLIAGEGDAIAQGIFLQYGLTLDDDVTAIRNGGFGSTGK